MNPIERRVKRVLSRRIEGFVLDKLGVGETGRLEEAKRREKQAQMEALARAAASNGGQQAQTSAGGTTPDAIREMMDDEDCPVCTRILSSLAEMEEPRRTKGVAEYGEFRSAIDQSEEAAVQTLEDAEVLPDALDNLRGAQL